MSRRTTVLVSIADAALALQMVRLARSSDSSAMVLLELPVVRRGFEDFPLELSTFQGKPKAGAGKTHEKKRIEREQRKQHGQKLRGR